MVICGFCRCCFGVSGGGKLLINSDINKILILVVLAFVSLLP